VPASLVSVLAGLGITVPTPIQAATLPDSIAGRDVLGRGRTGSGKTYAFLLPMITGLLEERRPAASRQPHGLILAPTRELAAQIEDSLRPLEKAAGLTSRTVFGGVGQGPQAKAITAGVDIVIACPGRLLDLMGQRIVDLSDVDITVIDEADQMADMGFLPMVRRILDATPNDGQRMLFSATLDHGIDVLTRRYLHDPVTHEADSETAPPAEMEHYVLRIDRSDRADVIADLAAAPGRTILFTRTKHGARHLARQLVSRGVPAVELHGNLSQGARTRNLAAFESGRVETLVATDIAARGIHVDDVRLVVHADPPVEHKAYLHRSGRTARAGHAGTVVTLVTPEQRAEVRQLMRKAAVTPEIAEARAGAAILTTVAPGERRTMTAAEAEQIVHPEQPAGSAGSAGGTAKPKTGSPSGRGRGHRSRGGSGGRSGSAARSGSGTRSGSGQGGRSGSAASRTGGRSSGRSRQAAHR